MNIHSQKFRRSVRLILSILQLVIDVAICIAYLKFSHIDSLLFQAFIVGLVVMFFSFASLYDFKVWIFWDELKACSRTVLYAWFVSMMLAYFVAPDDMMNITAGLALFVPIDLAARYVFRRVISALGLVVIDVVVCGAGSAGEIFAWNINESSFTLRKVRGFLDEDDEKRETTISGLPVLGKIRDFKNVMERMNVDEVVIAEPDAPRKTIINISHRFETYLHETYSHKVYILNTYSDKVRGVNDIQLTPATGGLMNPYNRCIKTIFDYIGGAIVIVFALPVMLPLAWKVKHGDGGAVFFRHQRAGKRLKPFRMYKFRTMVPGSEAILQEMLKDDKLRREFKTAFKFKNDPRITPFGKFLRKTSLDELPQIFNVLRGEMSLVGPRPIVQEEVDKYYGPIVSRHIFNAKPGMTGLWQVSGRNDVEDYDLRIKYDMYYVHNWSIFLDVMIILKTVGVVLNGRGAY